MVLFEAHDFKFNPTVRAIFPRLFTKCFRMPIKAAILLLLFACRNYIRACLWILKNYIHHQYEHLFSLFLPAFLLYSPFIWFPLEHVIPRQDIQEPQIK